jgi:two-component system response regulator NreC
VELVKASDQTPPIRVALVDDHAVLRSGLRMMIDLQPDMAVVAEAASAQGALEVVAQHAPDVLVLDLAMPGGGSIEAIRQIVQTSGQTRVLVLSMHDESSYLRAVIGAGGAGYVTKRAADTELLTAIRTVHAGRSYVDVSLSDRPPPLVEGRGPPPGIPRPTVLSDREREVLTLVALGYTNKEIAQQIHVSVKSVESYRARVADKLGLHSRAELVRYALETGLIG